MKHAAGILAGEKFHPLIFWPPFMPKLAENVKISEKVRRVKSRKSAELWGGNAHLLIFLKNAFAGARTRDLQITKPNG